MSETSSASSIKRSDAFEFLPATLEVLDTPPSHASRLLALSIAGFFSLSVIWAVFGQVDVVVVTQGQVVPTGRLKVVQPLQTGVVRAIHVKDGQHVTEGTALVELDSTEPQASARSLDIELVSARLEEAVGRALLSAEPETAFVAPQKAEPSLVQRALALLKDRSSAQNAALASLRADQDALASSMRAKELELQKLRDTLPLMTERVDGLLTLDEKGVGRRVDLLEAQQSLIEMQARERQVAENLIEDQARLDALQARTTKTVSDFQATERLRVVEARQAIDLLEQRSRVESQRLADQILRAPTSGHVHQLKLNTIGGVVTSAEPVLTIIPDDAPLQIEALAQNKDRGFIAVDQPVEIKIEAFPFTRYGTITGKVIRITDDVINDQQLGPVYKVTVAPDNSAITHDGETIPLRPGMTVAAEITTGSRRIIEYFLSPLLRYRDEAIRER